MKKKCCLCLDHACTVGGIYTKIKRTKYGDLQNICGFGGKGGVPKKPVGGSRLDLVGVFSGSLRVVFGGRCCWILSYIHGWASSMVVHRCHSLPFTHLITALGRRLGQRERIRGWASSMVVRGVLFIARSRWWWAFGERSERREACATSEQGGIKPKNQPQRVFHFNFF
jgi:hypothetical protein